MKYIIFLLSLLLSSNGIARISAYDFDNAEQEASYKKLTGELRCLVCQNQNIADSNAELAQDLKRKTYELVKQGQTEEQIVDYMTQRYGDFVMYRPPLRSTTFFLWLGPFLILAVGLFFLIRVIRSRRNSTADTELAAEDRAKAEDLLKSD